VFGFKREVSEKEVIKPVYYETFSELGSPPPAGQEKDFLLYVKQKLETEGNVKVNYAEVVGRNLTVQWKAVGTPILIEVIIGLAIAAITVWGLYMVACKTYEIISLMGAETSNMLFTAIGFFFILIGFSIMMSMFTGLLPRR